MSARRPVVLLLPDRRERAFLMAELQERGVDVVAEESVSAGLRRVLLDALSPRVIVWDVSVGPPGPKEIGILQGFAPEAKIVVIARPSVAVDESRWPTGVTFVERPVSVGELADTIQRLLDER